MNPTLPTITPAPSETPKMASSPQQTGAERTDSGNEKGFANHLDNAVQQKESKDSLDHDQPNDNNNNNNEIQHSTEKSQKQDSSAEILTPEKTHNDFSKNSVTSDEVQQTFTNGLTEQSVLNQQTLTGKSALNQQTLANTLTDNSALSQQSPANTLTDNSARNLQTLANNTTEPLGYTQEKITLPLQETTKASAALDSTKASTNSKEQPSILATQIQKILDSEITPQQIQIRGSQKNVTPTTTPSPPISQQTTATVTSPQNSAQTTIESSSKILINGETTPLRGNQRFESATHRQETSEQFLAAKGNKTATTGSSNNSANNSSTEQGQSESLLNRAPITTTMSPTGTNEPLSPFAQLLTPASSTPMGLNNLHGQQQVLMPSGTLVYEEQVMQQVHQQFNVTAANKAQSSINIRLTPVELGELKIDLTVKEGSVRVNVVAHSQQAQEILERNMPKLKSILEEQGLTIDEMSVTQASKSTDDFNLFDEQFAGGKGYSQDNPKKSSTFSQFNDPNPADLSSHDSNIDSPNSNGGVNLTI